MAIDEFLLGLEESSIHCKKQLVKTMTNEIKLTNFTIRDLLDKWGNQYFLLVDNNTEEAYFCFRRTVQSGWEQLNTGPTELIIEYQEDERENKIYKTVTNIIKTDDEIFI